MSAVSRTLPPGWSAKESNSNPGRYYYINEISGETTWDFPTKPASDNGTSRFWVMMFAFAFSSDDAWMAVVSKVRASHILVKHAGSRRPSSWKEVRFCPCPRSALNTDSSSL